MIFWIFIIVTSVLYTWLYTFLSGMLVLIPIWIITGILSSLVTLLLLVLLFIFVAPFSKPGNKAKHFIVHDAIVFLHHIFRIKIQVLGKENIPSDTHVVYGNHKSMLDITIVYQIYNEVITAVAKDSLMKVPLLRRLMKACAVIPINRENDREGVKNMLKAIQNVKDGLNYIIFPEGGVKSREVETMVALRPGAYKLATKPKATISPISIIGSSELSKKCPKHKTSVKVIIHKPISYEEYKDYQTNELGLRIGTIINQGVLTGKVNTKPLSEIEVIDFVKVEENE